MAVFSEEQRELLHAAFEHLWQRWAALHEDLNADAARLAVIADLLAEKGVITYAEFHDAVDALTAEAHAAAAVDSALLERQFVGELELTKRILAGDKEAFRRQLISEQAQREEDSQET